ncbi:sugar phosphate isomerase/epimerase, partial [Streptomyces sp. NPDC054834]
FDGTLTACVFAWEERAKESSVFMREKINEYLSTRN